MKTQAILLLVPMTVPQAWTPTQESPDRPLNSTVVLECMEGTVWAACPMLHNPTNMDMDMDMDMDHPREIRVSAGQSPGDGLTYNLGPDGDARKLPQVSCAPIYTQESADALIALAEGESGAAGQTRWWLNSRHDGEWAFMNLRRALLEKGILENRKELQQSAVPDKPEDMKLSVEDVLKLEGAAEKGRRPAAPCALGQEMAGQAVGYRSSPKGFGRDQPREEAARSIVDPSFDVSHGSDGQLLIMKGGNATECLVLAEGQVVRIRSTGGVSQDVPEGPMGRRKVTDRSLVANADRLGLNALDAADIAD